MADLPPPRDYPAKNSPFISLARKGVVLLVLGFGGLSLVITWDCLLSRGEEKNRVGLIIDCINCLR